MTDLCDLSATELRRCIGSKSVSPVELVESCIARIEAVNGAVNAVVTTSFDRARAEAKVAEQAVMDGEALGLLHGVPLGIKDLEATADIRTTYGSKLYADNVPTSDQGSVARMRGAGGIVVGKTNTPEFGAGANTRNLVFGATGNPFDPDKTCGGSSGGSAVALATGMVPLASGSDFGGSLRTPASFCGVVGYRPSPGTVPSENKPTSLLPFSVLGPMARSVDDVAMLLRASLAVDRRDPFSTRLDALLMEPLRDADLSGVRAAFSADLGCAPVARNIREAFDHRVASFRSVFAQAEDRDPDFIGVHESFETLRGVIFVGAHGARVRENRDVLSPNVVDNVDRGLSYSLEDVAMAHVEQSRIARAWLEFFDDVDVLICPAAAVSPFAHTDWSVTEIDGEEMPTYMRWLALTYAPTMAMACGCVIPCGVDDLGMPFGIQVLGPPGRDRRVLMVAAALEKHLALNPETMRPVPDIAKLSDR